MGKDKIATLAVMGILLAAKIAVWKAERGYTVLPDINHL